MKISTLLSVCSLMFLTGCLPDSVMPDGGGDSRYAISAYKEDATQNADLTGLWISIHNGTLTENKDGVDYTVTGSIREIVEVTKSGGVFYLRTCLTPEVKNPITISGDTVSFAVNDEKAQMTKTNNTAMKGNASHSTSGSSYSGTLEMRKVEPLNETFGLFNYLNNNLAKDVATASCFQEGSLRVVGKKMGFSKWADVEMVNVTDWTSTTFHKTSYMFSRAGSADPVNEVRFVEGSLSTGAVVREYPSGNESISIATTSSTTNEYKSSFNVNGVIAGTINLGFSIGTATTSKASGTTTSTPSTAGTSDGFNFPALFKMLMGAVYII